MLLLRLSQTNVRTSNQVPSHMLSVAPAEASLITQHTTILQLRAPQIWVGSFLQAGCLLKVLLGFPGGSVVKNPPANARDTGSITDPGGSQSHRAMKPMHHHCWACTLQPGSPNCWSPGALEPVLRRRSPCSAGEATAVRSQCPASRVPDSPQLAKPVQQWRPSTAKNK